MKIREKIQVIIDDKSVTDYRIGKETGLPISSVQRLRKGEFKMENLRLKAIEAYLEYYDRNYN